MEFESSAVPSYLQPDKESDFDAELNLPAAPTAPAAVPVSRQQVSLYYCYFLFRCLLCHDDSRTI